MDFSAALIAGGKSTRMGHDKALLQFEGGPLWQRQVCLLESLQPTEILLNGRPEQTYLKECSYPFIQDQWLDAGPLAGLTSVLQAARSARVLVLAVDLPKMPAACLKALLDASDNHVGAVYASSNGTEPLAAVYPKSALPKLLDALQQGQFRLQEIVQTLAEVGLMRILTLPDSSAPDFINVNTPAAWESLTQTPQN
jgi:molybdopterin-guanine dinucleotide biosynthesis protein A